MAGAADGAVAYCSHQMNGSLRILESSVAVMPGQRWVASWRVAVAPMESYDEFASSLTAYAEVLNGINTAVVGQTVANFTGDGFVDINMVLIVPNNATPSYNQLKVYLQVQGNVYIDRMSLQRTEQGQVFAGYRAKVESATGYFPFGMPMRSSNGNGYRYGFQGHEKDDEVKGDGNSLDFGARIYDPRIGRFLSVDPLAQERSWVSPYNFVQNNPINRVDPTGALDNPVYDPEGNLLGTDDQGLQGKAIIMDKDKFSQGMKHEDAMKNSLGYQGLKDDAAKANFSESYKSLSSRPDYDGIVTDAEARTWWNSKKGGELYIDISKLNLYPLTTKSFNGDEKLQYNFFTSVSSDIRTARVHGTLSMRLKNPSTGEVGFFKDNNGFFDTYDFNSDGRLIRDITTWGARQIVGEGKGFGFKPYGSNPTVPLK